MAVAVYHEGQWHNENLRLTGPMSHAFWMSSVVFDGARAFDGMAPDVDQHCERLYRSAKTMFLEPQIDIAEVIDLCHEGARRFPKDAELYIRPMFFAQEGFLIPEPESTNFVLAVYEAPMPEYKGIGVCLSSRRRPARDMAPTDAKASCLYPNSTRALVEAGKRGFDNAILLDANGNVAELASANVWIVKDGVAMTPAINGTFLPGVTRNRTIELLRAAGTEVVETTISFEDVLNADEVFTTGNYGKVLPITRVESQDYQRGRVTDQARELYWDYSAKFPLF
ncbi:MAG: branched-chain amino acid aminotransferase [Alphaproteobacteria bacterium]